MRNLTTKRGINLERFENSIAIQFVNVINAKTILEFETTKDKVKNGKLQELFEEYEIIKLDNEYVDVYSIDYNRNIKCNVFINGVVVLDLAREIGIG